jgi:hypothetical protein
MSAAGSVPKRRARNPSGLGLSQPHDGGCCVFVRELVDPQLFGSDLKPLISDLLVAFGMKK